MQEWTEWTAQTEIVANWKQEIESGGRKFGDVLAETKAQTKRPDITLFEKPQQKSPAIIVEIKAPHGLEDLDRLKLVLRTTGVKYAVTWDLVQFAVWKLEKGELRPHFHPQEMQVCAALTELKREDIRQRLRDASSKFLRELEHLYEKGTLTQVTPPYMYFVNRLHRAVEELCPEVENLLAKKRAQRPFSARVNDWAVTQGMPLSLDNFNQVVASHWIYKTIVRSIFYITIQRDFEHKLPPLYDEHIADIGQSVKRAFDAASQVDWQAVFLADELDDVLSDGLALTPFQNLLHDLNAWEFRNLPHDIIGMVFERLIPEDKRHSLGQFFTPINLVDLMLGFVIKQPDGIYCDPTCGTGTFLIRAYNRLYWLSKRALKHNQLLGKLWGIDIANFPAELATISLFRQKPDDHHNFPRIIRRDIFQVKAGQKFEFPPPTAPRGEFKKVEVPFPPMKGLVGNFPYIRQETIEKHSREITKGKLSRLIADEMNGVYTDIIKNGTDIHLSGQADIYAYMFFHVYTFLEDGGRMAFLTSNSWLDTAFGQHLKRFFLRKFKIIAVVGSWVEPWFEDASVNTVFVVLEKCDKPDDCMNHSARFVRLNKRLADLLPFNPETDESHRWERVGSIINSIENTPPP